jgi:hypothetical protein
MKTETLLAFIKDSEWLSTAKAILLEMRRTVS